ncbi:MAG: hypothetical protein HY291_12505 [Planctomycetes bacterium]|nr:hypothetical protein [Planctomycetota bacterium]
MPILIATAVVLLLHTSLHAETPGEEYQLAIDLLSRQGPRFQAEDLVERIAVKLEASGSVVTRLEAKLVRAALLRSKARAAGDEKRGDLLSQARKLYTEFLAEGPNHPLAGLCRTEAAGMEREVARALLAAAEKDPAKAAEKRKEAAEILAKIAADAKAEAERLRPALAEAFRKYDAYVEQHPDARVPQELIAACRRALAAFVPADKKQVLARMEEAEAYAAADAQRKAKAADVAAYCKAQMEWELYFHAGLEPIGMWFGFAKGRAHALALEDKQAEECWHEALELVDEYADPQVQKEAKEIKLLVGREFVKLKLRQAANDSKRYAEAAEVVDFLEKQYADLAEKDLGKDLLIDGATARRRSRASPRPRRPTSRRPSRSCAR